MEENQENNTQENVNETQNIENNTNNESSQTETTTSNFNINKEDLKKETSETVNQVKDTFKNADIKKDSKEAKGFISSFFKDPLGELKKVTSSSGNKFLKVAIVILVVWLVSILISNVFSIASNYLFGTFGSFSYFFKHLFSNILDIIKDLVAPIITILVLSGLVYGFSKNKDKSFLTIASSILIAEIPTVIATVVNLLTIIGSGIFRLTSAFSGFCSILSTILLYFAIKNLSNEENNSSYFWKFALIMGIFYVVKFVFSYLEIYL